MKRSFDRTKSDFMREWFPESSLVHNEQTYHVIDLKTNFANNNHTHYASVGASKSPLREICIYDTSTAGNEYNQKMFQGLDQNARISLIFNDLNQRFGQANAEVEYELDQHIEFKGIVQQRKIPIVDLCELMRLEYTVCRHRSLYLAACLGNLVKRGLLQEGSVRIYRDVLSFEKGSRVSGGHAWVMYCNKQTGDEHLIDLTWQKQYNLNSVSGFPLAERLYGDKVIHNMLERLAEADKAETAAFVEQASTNPPNEHASAGAEVMDVEAPEDKAGLAADAGVVDAGKAKQDKKPVKQPLQREEGQRFAGIPQVNKESVAKVGPRPKGYMENSDAQGRVFALQQRAEAWKAANGFSSPMNVQAAVAREEKENDVPATSPRKRELFKKRKNRMR